MRKKLTGLPDITHDHDSIYGFRIFWLPFFSFFFFLPGHQYLVVTSCSAREFLSG